MGKGSLDTPFVNASPTADKNSGEGVFDHNNVESIGHKADIGSGDLKLKFAETLMPSKEALATPFMDPLGGEGIKNPKGEKAGTGGGSVSKGSLDTPFANATKK